jgi:hypothetical protein
VGLRPTSPAADLEATEHAHEAAMWTMPDPSLAARLAGAAPYGLALCHERTRRSGTIGQRASNSVSVCDLRRLSRPLLSHPCGAWMAAGEPVSIQMDRLLGADLGQGRRAWDILTA